MPVTLIKGLSEIEASYDALICDVWGVLHNSREAKPQAWEACARFHQSRPVILFSNAPRLPVEVQKQLTKLGVPSSCYDAIVTSGAVTHDALKRRTEHHRLKLFHLGPERDHSVYEGLNVEIVPAEEAELILCTGLYDDETETAENYRPLFQKLLPKKLTMLCVNPDIVVMRGERLIYCAGALARAYEEMGGQVLYYGKPHLPIYHAVMECAHRFGIAARPLVVGDGLETDIKGANAAGIDALFIMDGIFSNDIASKSNPASVERLLNDKDVGARYAMTALAW